MNEKKYDDEKMRVLYLLEKEEISSDEAGELLDALEERPMEYKKKKKAIKIQVSENGEEKVNIKVPLKLAKVVARFIPEEAKNSMEKEGIYIQDVIEALDNELDEEPIVDINDGSNCVNIRIV